MKCNCWKILTSLHNKTSYNKYYCYYFIRTCSCIEDFKCLNKHKANIISITYMHIWTWKIHYNVLCIFLSLCLICFFILAYFILHTIELKIQKKVYLRLHLTGALLPAREIHIPAYSCTPESCDNALKYHFCFDIYIALLSTLILLYSFCNYWHMQDQ